MINYKVTFILLFLVITVSAQTSKISSSLQNEMNNLESDNNILIWVYFTDKGSNTAIYFNNPHLVVSRRSIQRREKVLGKWSLLTFKDIPLNNYYITQVKSGGLKIKHHSKWLNAVSGVIKKENLNNLTSLSFVQKLDIVYQLKKEPVPDNFVPAPGNKNYQQSRSFDYGSSYDEMQQINIPAVHNMGYTGQEIMICVMDAGFNRLSHTVFSSMNIVAAWDFVNNDPNVGDEGDMGTGSHGTMTLSTIGGYAPGHLIGPAFNSNFILAKTENTDSETPIEEDNWIAAMEWADSIGVDVTSTSLGYIDFDPPWPSYTWMDMDGNTTVITNGADYAAQIGIVVINSAGNDGYNSSHNTLGAPADGDSVITAGAVNYDGSRSSFSSVGPTVDGRIKPDIMALGSGNVVASPYDNFSYTYASGTSFSCPLSAGVAALILCANPSLTPMQVRDAMRNTASRNNNPDNLFGWGILNTLDAVNYFPPIPAAFQLSVNVNNGWNLVSVPGINPEGMNINNWWVNHMDNVYKFIPGAGYSSINSTTSTEGYWMKNVGDQIYNTGDEWPADGIEIVSHDTLTISGWTLIGVYECPVQVNDIVTIPPGQNIGPIFGFSNGYVEVDTLFPGYGYWIKFTGQITFPPCPSFEKLNRN